VRTERAGGERWSDHRRRVAAPQEAERRDA
jgi:hypothetical protein